MPVDSLVGPIFAPEFERKIESQQLARFARASLCAKRQYVTPQAHQILFPCFSLSCQRASANPLFATIG